MLAYAAHRPIAGDRNPHPNTMLVIIGVHVALIAALMSARMEVEKGRPPDPPLIRVPLAPEPPPSQPSRIKVDPRPLERTLGEATKVEDGSDLLVPSGKEPGIDVGQNAGSGTSADTEVPKPVTHSDPTLPRLLTAPAELRPPYPAEKLLNEEEAALTLRLMIDADGRVTAVEPVGPADPVFLNAARRHLLAHWRYAPATRDGTAVASTVVVTLRFELNG